MQFIVHHLSCPLLIYGGIAIHVTFPVEVGILGVIEDGVLRVVDVRILDVVELGILGVVEVDWAFEGVGFWANILKIKEIKDYIKSL